MSVELSVSEVGIGRSVAGVAADREREFRTFVTTQRDRAIALAAPLLNGDLEAAQDAAQEAFIKAHDAWGRFRGHASRKTWFTRILLNCVRSKARKRRRRLHLAALLAPAAVAAGGKAEPAASEVLSRARICDALANLTAAQREVFVLVHLQELTLSETAELLGKPLGTLKSHLHRALESLRRQLGDLRTDIAEHSQQPGVIDG